MVGSAEPWAALMHVQVAGQAAVPSLLQPAPAEGQCLGTWSGTAGGDTSCVEIVMRRDWELIGDRYPHLGDVGRSEAALMVLPDNGTALHMKFPALNSSGVRVKIPKSS